MFDQKTVEELKYYVYALIDPRIDKPFYIGKGIGNRVFNHLRLALEEETENLKYDTIRSILSDNNKVKHIIVRHGLDEESAFVIESTLIDFLGYFNFGLSNLVAGHNTFERGIMTTDEIIRIYNAQPLQTLDDAVVIININSSYKRGSNSFYEATKEYWVIGARQQERVKYALSEYRGLIVEVFEIDNWYPVNTKDKQGKDKIKWGFNGKIASEEIRQKYINKSVAHAKKKGAANPIRYKL